MSLGIVFRGPEGIVLAADSRVTLMALQQQPVPMPTGPVQVLLPATFDNATKLLRLNGAPHCHVGAVTYGAGAIGVREQRTAHSFLPEFESELGTDRLTVEEYARRLSDFFMRQWTAFQMPMPGAVPGVQGMVFLVAGYNDGEPYGKVYEFVVPNQLVPVDKFPTNDFGAIWGGQTEVTDRIIQGFDNQAPGIAVGVLNQPGSADAVRNELRSKLGLPIPWPFLPLQDCVDLSIFLVRTTITLQKWLVGIRGVGGAVDVATITRTAGFRPVQQKQIVGEARLH